MGSLPTLSSVSHEKLRSLPLKPGVYLFKDKTGQVIYVGKARSLRQRVKSYFSKKPDIKTSLMLSRLNNIDYIVTPSEMEALILEDELVKKYQPRYNILLRDDKTYPYLKLTVNETWPRLFLVRRKEKDGAFYFGRFQGSMVREIIRLAKKMFPIRWCSETPLKRREQPCLYARIGRCCAPCVGKINREDYLEMVEGIILLLQGKIGQSVGKLKTEMARAATNHDFELAAALRDRIKLLEKMLEAKNLTKAPAPQYLTEVRELQQSLNLTALPVRIESFDISNLQGLNMVASMVTFVGGFPLKREYRRFIIRTVKDKPNDVGAIYEVVKRRYSGSLSKKLSDPQLVLIDGGLGQVNAGERALEESHKEIPLIGLAKQSEEIYFPGRAKPKQLGKASTALKLLQRIRDEAHRFAVTFHREKRKKTFFSLAK